MKEFLRLVEEFVNMIGMQMSGFQDIYEVTENLGELRRSPRLLVLIESASLILTDGPFCSLDNIFSGTFLLLDVDA